MAKISYCQNAITTLYVHTNVRRIFCDCPFEEESALELLLDHAFLRLDNGKRSFSLSENRMRWTSGKRKENMGQQGNAIEEG